MTLSIEDKIELHELAARYGDIIDDRNWPALETVFTRDAVFEVVDLVRMEGLAGIRHYMENEGRHPLAHLITNIHIREEPGRVMLRCRGIFPISGPEGPGNRVFYGSYYDEAVRTAAGWRISHRVFSTARLAMD
ncbi:MAG: nuclear transport factor 2 family protein [Halieaceae bacterium]|jgi:3-phenylpropionate/cinnamic acid dioxygenase small subunit|nr:nuclear transport factor 2 family protein [Halieaceae bacterium]